VPGLIVSTDLGLLGSGRTQKEVIDPAPPGAVHLAIDGSGFRADPLILVPASRPDLDSNPGQIQEIRGGGRRPTDPDRYRRCAQDRLADDGYRSRQPQMGCSEATPRGRGRFHDPVRGRASIRQRAFAH